MSECSCDCTGTDCAGEGCSTNGCGNKPQDFIEKTHELNRIKKVKPFLS